MEEVGTVQGWTFYRYEDRFYVRAEDVARHLASNGEVKAILAHLLHVDVGTTEADGA